MRLALLADIHANTRALDAVLDAVSALDVHRIVVLGDLVGYNAEPDACVDRVRSIRGAIVVAGNHDRAISGTDVDAGTNAAVRSVIAWTRGVLSPSSVAYLRALPGIVEDQGAGFAAIHGSFLNDVHTYGYVTSTIVEENLDALAARRSGVRIGFCGHTHVPMIAWREPRGVFDHVLGAEARWPDDAVAVIINPGSVGQPRDGDRRASFAVVDLDARLAGVHRVPYDVEGAAHAVQRAGLPVTFAERLFEGR